MAANRMAVDEGDTSSSSSEEDDMEDLAEWTKWSKAKFELEQKPMNVIRRDHVASGSGAAKSALKAALFKQRISKEVKEDAKPVQLPMEDDKRRISKKVKVEPTGSFRCSYVRCQKIISTSQELQSHLKAHIGKILELS